LLDDCAFDAIDAKLQSCSCLYALV